MSNVLIDYHHTDLAESLHRLFEDRLGFKVYVPDGLGWYEQGYWQFGRSTFGDDRLGRQFLMAPDVDPLNPDRKLRRVSVEEANQMDWDVVVATVPDNYNGYWRFAARHGARFVIEVGNVRQQIDLSLNPLILDSTGQYPADSVPFTPEYDIKGAFRHSTPSDQRRVASFVNLFPGLPCYPLFDETRFDLLLKGWRADVYGHNGDEFVEPTSAIGPLMAWNAFGWHDKVSGDGFGYVIHYWASVGRPIIGHASHYRGQVAADLWEDGVTCIDLDKHSPSEAAQLMEEIVSDPARHEAMCSTIASRVRARVDFAADAERVADALGLAVAA